MATLVIGKTGQLARALAPLLPGATFLGRDALDLAMPVRDLPACVPPLSGVILAAAYTAVDRAESEPGLAWRVNGEAVGEIARLCAARGVPLIHASTDYVFSGESRDGAPWAPDDTPAPLNAYGESKLAGERAIADSGARAAVLRTSWVFDGVGANFLSTMLRLGAGRDAVRVVADQWGRPTYAGHLARACVAALRGLQAGHPGGTFHATSTGEPTTWAGFAQAIFQAAGMATRVEPIPSSGYPTPAARPGWSVLDTSSFEDAFGLRLPSWREGLAAALAERDGAERGASEQENHA